MVVWSEPAKADLQHIFEYITHDSRHYAKKVTQEIVDKTGVLNELPHVGRAVPEVGSDNIRELSLYLYRIIYEIMDADISILAIVRGLLCLTPGKEVKDASQFVVKCIFGKSISKTVKNCRRNGGYF